MINSRKIIIAILPVFFLLPLLAYSAGFVPCDGTDSNPCDFDSLITMVNVILQWFISIAFILAAIGMTYSGARIVMAAGKPEELTAARNMFWNIIKGTLFVAGAWLIVYTIMTTLVSDSTFLRFLQ